jgi:hypothetical protein
MKKNALSLRLTALALSAALITSCIFQSVPECPDKEELLSGGWQLTLLEINDQPQTGDISKFKLRLSETGTFTRISIDEFSDDGQWLLTNNGNVLELIPQDQPSEEYIIDSFTLRKLVLFVDRDNNKVGPDNIKLYLDRFN